MKETTIDKLQFHKTEYEFEWKKYLKLITMNSK